MDREAINQRLHELFLQTMDQSILQYIQSGWTTPVSPAVQARVSQIVGRPVPAGQNVGGITLPTGQPTPNAAATSIDAPQSVALPDAPGGLPTTGFGGYTNNQPGVNQATGYGYEGPPQAGAGLGGLFSGDPGLTNPPASALPAGGPYAAPGRGRTEAPPPAAIGTNPASGGSTVNPLFPGAAGGGSAVQDAGYQAAMGGDRNALDLVLGKLLSNYGVDVTRPGLFTGSLVKSVAPYLETFLRYYGLNGAGEPALDRAKAAAGEFGGMLGSGGTFGQIQDAAQGMLGTAGDLLGNARGALANPANQQGMIADLLGMLTAGDNGIRQQSLQGQLLGANYDYGQEQLAGATGGYMDFLRRQAGTGKLPGGDLLAQILGGATAGR